MISSIFIFCRFGYRIVFAVATQDSVLLYDSQQDLPFGYISQIHYTRLSDVSWSPDGRLLLISSTDGFCTFVTFEKDEIGIPYNGPKHDYFKKLETSPVVETPKEFAPESDKTKRTVNSTPSIKSFFKPRNSNLSPVVEANEEKVAAKVEANSSDNVSESKGEVMEVDLTQEDSKDIETTPKRPKCDSVASKRSPLKSVNEAVSASILTAPPISQIKENSVVNLVNQFDSCLSPSSLSIASLISNEEHQKSSKKVENEDASDLPNKKIKLSSATNVEVSVPKFKATETSKQPRRVQLITLSLPK